MAKGSMSQILFWKKMTGVLYILGGLFTIGVALYIWLVVFPGGMTISGRPELALYTSALVGGVAAIIIGIWVLSLKLPEVSVVQPELMTSETETNVEEFAATQPDETKKMAKEYRLKCKSCGQMFKVPDVSGPIKCPFCEATGKIR
ncbi:MAG: hypothetical protein CVT47_01870 [Thermoplasmata archaeon HGW-Thermoplasmata-2]|nr:MAG: hypothetical protein CVT47_01870 [Thermoplasmata archaeon HGW-Thermoplasmata-2]